MGRPRALLLRALLSHKTQSFPCSPKGYKPKPRPEVPHVLICRPASHANKSLSSLECALVGLRVAILSQQLSPSGSGARCSQPPGSGSGNHGPCYTGSWWGPGRPTSQGSGFFIRPSEKQKFLLSYSRPHGFSLFFQPALILNAHPRTSCMTSCPAPLMVC